MKKSLIIGIIILAPFTALCQSAEAIITKVKEAQALLKTIAYAIDRTDTLVTGDIRSMHGKSFIEVDKTDTLLGFKFWSKEASEPTEKIYDGHIGYEINLADKKYTLQNSKSALHSLLLSGGGRIILPDIIQLNIIKNTGFDITQDEQNYYLTVHYADYKPEDVINRRRVYTIDKKLMLPIAMRNHQETLGKVQDLYYHITDIHINDPACAYNFSSVEFLKNYTHRIIANTARPVLSLIGKQAPQFQLTSFTNQKVVLSDLIGKVTLLDFWEVWCGPCLEAMPQVEKIFDKYKSKGLLVYGITNDLKQLPSAKLLVQKRGIKIPTLIGNEQLKKDYEILGVPYYVLINKKGAISFIQAGYSVDIEGEIEKELLK